MKIIKKILILAIVGISLHRNDVFCDTYPSKFLITQLKREVANYIKTRSQESREFIQKTIFNDIKIQCNNIQKDPDGYGEYIGNMDWMLFNCIDLANNPATKDFFKTLQDAVKNYRKYMDETGTTVQALQTNMQ